MSRWSRRCPVRMLAVGVLGLAVLSGCGDNAPSPDDLAAGREEPTPTPEPTTLAEPTPEPTPEPTGLFPTPIQATDVDGYIFALDTNGLEVMAQEVVADQKPGFTGVRLFPSVAQVRLDNLTPERTLSFPAYPGSTEDVNHWLVAFQAAWHIESPVCQAAVDPRALPISQFCYAPIAYGRVPYEIPAGGSATIDLVTGETFGGEYADILGWSSGVGQIPEAQLEDLWAQLSAPDQVFVVLTGTDPQRLVTGCAPTDFQEFISEDKATSTGTRSLIAGRILNATGPSDWFCNGGTPLPTMPPA